MSRKFAISDIHGCYNTFEKLLSKINLQKEDQLFLLGDYIHRGNDGFKVIDLIIRLISDGYKIEAIAGNHEIMLINTFNSNRLQSNIYFEFCSSLKMKIEADNFTLIHSDDYLNFEKLPENAFTFSQQANNLKRKQILQQTSDNQYVIYGHKIQTRDRIENSVKNKFFYLPIDNGCYKRGTANFGSLCAFDFTNWVLYFENCCDDL